MRRHLLLAALGIAVIAVFVLFGLMRIPEVQAQNPPNLYWGSSGGHVATLQVRLRDWGYYNGPIDAWLGPKTWVALKDFQAKNGLPVDGIVEANDWAALGVAVRPPAGGGGGGAVARTAPAGYTATRGVSVSEDVRLLSHLVGGEAEGEPYSGQVAVAAVILNRIGSAEFPNSLSGVVYQPLAFESVANGQIWRIGDLPTATRAAQDALNGWDPTGGALFFWNPSKPVNRWIWSRRIITQIGSHVFAL